LLELELALAAFAEVDLRAGAHPRIEREDGVASAPALTLSRAGHLRQPWSQCAPDEHSDAGRDLPSLAKDPLFK